MAFELSPADRLRNANRGVQNEDLKRLDQAIDDLFLKPILDNHQFNYSERQWYSLPPRKGGLGIIIPSEVSDSYYQNSRYMT